MLPSSVFNLEPTLALNELVFPSIFETTVMGGQAPQQLTGHHKLWIAVCSLPKSPLDSVEKWFPEMC